MSAPIEQHLVAKSNALIQACYRLTLHEQRLILLAVSSIHSKRAAVRPGLNQVQSIRITAEEFAGAWKLPVKQAYEALREATLDLFNRSLIEIQGKKTIRDRWVSRVIYHDGEGWAELSFNHHIWPHLTELGREFTEYRIGQVANLRSTYAVRIFEWCVQFAKTGWMVITIKDLQQRLGLSYGRFVDVRRKVIEPAVKELRTKSNLEIDWTPIKEGKKVTAVRFDFNEQSQVQLDL